MNAKRDTNDHQLTPNAVTTRGAMPPATSVTLGVLGLLQIDRRFLMIQRPYEIRVGGVWCFPGGHIEPGESAAEALVREMQEEVGLAVEPIEQFFTLTKNDGHLVLKCWIARAVVEPVTVVPNPREVLNHRWMSLDEMRRMPVAMNSVAPGTPDSLISGSIEIVSRLPV